MGRALLLLLYALAASSYSQDTSWRRVQIIMDTYAFLEGQHEALSTVEDQYPTLRHDVHATRKVVDPIFESARTNAHKLLLAELGRENFGALQLKIRSTLDKQYEKPIEKEAHARDFLQEVRRRANGDLDKQLPAAILHLAYIDEPHNEWLLDPNHFAVAGNANLRLKMPMPKSWKEIDPAMPQALKHFTSMSGNGSEHMIVIAYDVSESKGDLLSENSIKEMIPPNAKLHAIESIEIDGYRAVSVDAEEEFEASGKRLKVRMLQFMIVAGGKLLCLQGSVGPITATRDIQQHFKTFEPLFRLMALSTDVTE
ncbi:MAG: hypothetical protein EOO50_10285 [Flavobacterium sp.]|uniref:hypothetical protein n=1 Tax=Flavobacterium sp. TaxID=239 RepID=UPI0012297DA8|nr:hypothetical protein [Flavobacterium sp.]RZJ66311.1 MAG: hypothetical protein EOO50_10285 [Flavobacterium sp.]